MNNQLQEILNKRRQIIQGTLPPNTSFISDNNDNTSNINNNIIQNKQPSNQYQPEVPQKQIHHQPINVQQKQFYSHTLKEQNKKDTQFNNQNQWKYLNQGQDKQIYNVQKQSLALITQNKYDQQQSKNNISQHNQQQIHQLIDQQNNHQQPQHSQFQGQDHFIKIVQQSCLTNQAMIRQSYLPGKNEQTFSHALLKTNLAAYFKNYLLRKTDILTNIDMSIKRIPKQKDKYSFPSMTQKIRPKNYNRTLYFDRDSDIIPSFLSGSETRVSRALADAHNNYLEDFKRKVKASKLQSGYVVLYDWQSDPLSLKQLKYVCQFVPSDECWIFLNHSKIKKSLNKLQTLIEHNKIAQNFMNCQKYKQLSKQLKLDVSKFFSLSPIERNHMRIELQKKTTRINSYDFQ